MIGLKTMRGLQNQSDTKLKPIASRDPRFPALHVSNVEFWLAPRHEDLCFDWPCQFLRSKLYNTRSKCVPYFRYQKSSISQTYQNLSAGQTEKLTKSKEDFQPINKDAIHAEEQYYKSLHASETRISSGRMCDSVHGLTFPSFFPKIFQSLFVVKST